MRGTGKAARSRGQWVGEEPRGRGDVRDSESEKDDEGRWTLAIISGWGEREGAVWGRGRGRGWGRRRDEENQRRRLRDDAPRLDRLGGRPVRRQNPSARARSPDGQRRRQTQRVRHARGRPLQRGFGQGRAGADRVELAGVGTSVAGGGRDIPLSRAAPSTAPRRPTSPRNNKRMQYKVEPLSPRLSSRSSAATTARCRRWSSPHRRRRRRPAAPGSSAPSRGSRRGPPSFSTTPTSGPSRTCEGKRDVDESAPSWNEGGQVGGKEGRTRSSASPRASGPDPSAPSRCRPRRPPPRQGRASPAGRCRAQTGRRTSGRRPSRRSAPRPCWTGRCPAKERAVRREVRGRAEQQRAGRRT